MDVQLDPRRTLILWSLLGEGGTALQKDLRPAVRKADRDALTACGLIRTEAGADGVLRVHLTEQGWAWAQAHLDARLPANSTAGAPVLEAWLSRLQRFLQARGLSLAEVITNVPAAAAPAGTAEARPPSTTKSGAPAASTSRTAAPDNAALFDRIRLTYLAITGGALDKPVPLRDLRERLADLDRARVDEALRAFVQAGLGSLRAIERDRALTESDRAAALIWDDRPHHLLKIAF